MQASCVVAAVAAVVLIRREEEGLDGRLVVRISFITANQNGKDGIETSEPPTHCLQDISDWHRIEIYIDLKGVLYEWCWPKPVISPSKQLFVTNRKEPRRRSLHWLIRRRCLSSLLYKPADNGEVIPKTIIICYQCAFEIDKICHRLVIIYLRF